MEEEWFIELDKKYDLSGLLDASAEAPAASQASSETPASSHTSSEVPVSVPVSSPDYPDGSVRSTTSEASNLNTGESHEEANEPPTKRKKKQEEEANRVHTSVTANGTK